ncbi:AfsA-related hotdog domain-containing protein [Actinokineospora sp. 24-640]
MSQPARETTPAAPDSVVGPMTATAEGWSAPLWIPEDHPFFFDHPLDHVSGMLTICGMLDVVTALAGDPIERGDRRMLVDLTFRGISDLERPSEVLVSEADDRYLVRTEQGGASTCDGSVRLVDGIVPRTGPTPAGGTELCPPELVHRHRVENVMLGAPVETAEGITAPLLAPPRGHYLDGFGGARYSVRGLIEASRQFFTVLLHRAADKPMGTTTFWMRLGADLPCSPTTEDALSLRWRRVGHRGTRITVAFDLVATGSGAVLGSFEYHAVAVSAVAYQRFRARSAA